MSLIIVPQIKYCRFDNSLLVPLVSKPAQNSHGRLRWHLHPGWGEGLTWLSSFPATLIELSVLLLLPRLCSELRSEREEAAAISTAVCARSYGHSSRVRGLFGVSTRWKSLLAPTCGWGRQLEGLAVIPSAREGNRWLSVGEVFGEQSRSPVQFIGVAPAPGRVRLVN